MVWFDWQRTAPYCVSVLLLEEVAEFLHEGEHRSCGRSRPALLHALMFSTLQTTSEFLHTEAVVQPDASIGKSAQEQTPTAHLGRNLHNVDVRVDASERDLK